MTDTERKALEAAGFSVEDDPYDWLGLTEEERQLIEVRLAVARGIRMLREKLGLSQIQLALKLGSSQSRIAKVESASQGVSLDLALKALFALGGRIEDVPLWRAQSPQPAASKGKPQRDRVKAKRS